MQKVHFRLTSVAHKRCCLSSLISLLRPLQRPEFRLPSKWENSAWYQVSSLSNLSGSLLGFLAFIVFCLSWVSAFLVSVVLVIFFYSSVDLAEYLTIIPRARMGSESIAHVRVNSVSRRNYVPFSRSEPLSDSDSVTKIVIYRFWLWSQGTVRFLSLKSTERLTILIQALSSLSR